MPTIAKSDLLVVIEDRVLKLLKAKPDEVVAAEAKSEKIQKYMDTVYKKARADFEKKHESMKKKMESIFGAKCSMSVLVGNDNWTVSINGYRASTPKDAPRNGIGATIYEAIPREYLKARKKYEIAVKELSDTKAEFAINFHNYERIRKAANLLCSKKRLKVQIGSKNVDRVIEEISTECVKSIRGKRS